MNITPLQIDALTETVNIGVGRAATVLNRMVKSHVDLKVPSLKILDPSKPEDMSELAGIGEFASVSMPFEGSLSGVAAFCVSTDSAYKLVSLLTGVEKDSPELESLMRETLNEIGNIVISGVMGSISNMCNFTLKYSIPTFSAISIDSFLEDHHYKEGGIIFAQANFSIKERKIEGSILILFRVGSLQSLLSALENS